MSGVLCGVSHQNSDGVVATEVSPDLLVDQLWGLRAKHLSRSSLVGL